MARGPVLNPIRAAGEINPPPTLSRESKAIARRVARFEAQRAQEDSMGIELQDMNPGAAHQTKATFTPKKSTAPAPPPQQKFEAPPKLLKRAIPERPANPAVQRIRPMAEPEAGPSIFDEMAADFGGSDQSAASPDETPQPQAPGSTEDPELQSYIDRFKGDPGERLRAMAKSYSESEKRMRHLENERKLFANGHYPQPTQQQQAQQAQPNAQVQVAPKFNYGRVANEILDDKKGAQLMQDFEAHIASQIRQEMSGPLQTAFNELVDNRLFRKFPDVVSEDNLDIIKAMAHNEPGASLWEKSVNAVNKYKAAMNPTGPHVNTSDIQAMQQAAQTPTPQARPQGGKKMWRESDLRAEMQKLIRKGGRHWQEKRHLFDQAFRENRVLRGQ